MAILTIDTETQSLNTHNFIMGTICDEKYTCTSFRDKEELWLYLNRYIEKYARWQECLFIYAHNMHYDFLVIQPKHLPQNYTLYCHTPYIIDVKDDKGRIVAKFLSTTSLFRGSLAEMGEAMGYKKIDTPQWLTLQSYTPNFAELAVAEQYMEKDAKIVMKYLHHLKAFLKENDIHTRWLITSGQIGVNYFLNEISKASNKDAFLQEGKWNNEFLPTQHKEEIHQANRGGRVEAFAFGAYENVSNIDINSHYPDCLSRIRMPDLRTETKIEHPLEYMSERVLLDKIGISNCLIRVKKNVFGVLPVRTGERKNFYPNTDGQLIYGTWSHDEIVCALERGYELINVYWSITYEETENPFGFIHTLAHKRLESINALEKHFLKMLMNAGIGKFSQRRKDKEYKWVETGGKEEYTLLQDNWGAVEEAGRYRLYMQEKDYTYKRFYCPILNVLITSLGRIRLLELMERVGKDVLYCDTDGFLVKNLEKETFIYNNLLGGYKLEFDSQKALIYARKHYMIGGEIKMSGVGKLWRNAEAFQEGVVHFKRMITELMSQDPSLIGTFREETRNLQEIMEEAQKEHERLSEETLFIDERNLADVATIQEDLWMQHKDLKE